MVLKDAYGSVLKSVLPANAAIGLTLNGTIFKPCSYSNKVCVCARARAHICVHMCMYTHACINQRTTLAVIPLMSSSFCFRQSLIDLHQLARLAGQRAADMVLSSPPSLHPWDYKHTPPCPAFCPGSGDPK